MPIRKMGSDHMMLHHRRIAAVTGTVLLAAIALTVIYGLWSLSGSMALYRPLVAKNGWSATGAFKAHDFMLSPADVPRAFGDDPEFQIWLALRPESGEGDERGEVSTVPFPPPRYLAVPYAGSPGLSAQTRIFLRCENGGKELQVSRFRMNDQWGTSFVAVPPDFCSGNIRLVALNEGLEFMGIATPFEVAEATYNAHTGIFARALVVAATWLSLLVCGFVSAFSISRFWPQVSALGSGLAGIAVGGMLMLSAFTISPSIGKAVAMVLGGLAIVAAITIALRERDWTASITASWRLPSALWLAVALFYAGLVTAADNGGGSWWINGLFTPLGWSTDNQIPGQFAEFLFQGRPATEIHWGAWIATDRTPLLSGLLLFPRVVILGPLADLFGSNFVPTAYMMSSIAVLSMWVIVAAAIVQKIAGRHLAVVLVLMAATPFLLFNTVYAWPKLLGAAFAVASLWLLFDLSQRRAREPVNLVLVAVLAVAACLSHASNALAMLPIALLFLPTILRQRPLAIVVAMFGAVLLALPWLYWQSVIQPHGNALMRYALAYDYDINNRSQSIFAAVRNAYAATSFWDWLDGKISSFRLMVGLQSPDFGLQEMAPNSPGAGVLGDARVRDFLSLGHSMAATFLGLIAVPFVAAAARRRSDASRFMVFAALAGIFGVVVTVLVTLPPGIVHHQAYGSILLLVLAGALTIASAPAWIAWGVTIIQLGYFLVVWIWHPIAIANVVHGSAIFCMTLAAATFVWLLAIEATRPVGAGAMDAPRATPM